MARKKLTPKDKHTTKSWQTRNAARDAKQADHAANLLLAARDADDAELIEALKQGELGWAEGR